VHTSSSICFEIQGAYATPFSLNIIFFAFLLSLALCSSGVSFSGMGSDRLPTARMEEVLALAYGGENGNCEATQAKQMVIIT